MTERRHEDPDTRCYINEDGDLVAPGGPTGEDRWPSWYMAQITDYAVKFLAALDECKAAAYQDERELRSQITALKAELEKARATLSMTVGRLGGEVEGCPTQRINFLQRIDALREIESNEGVWRERAEFHAERSEQARETIARLKAELAEARSGLSKRGDAQGPLV